MKDIVIYPSSWYYNACVQGFLEIIAWGLGPNGAQIVGEKLLKDDGRVVIPGELAEAIFGDQNVPMPAGFNSKPIPEELDGMKRISWWWVGKGYEQGFIRAADREHELETSLEKVETVTRNLLVGSRNRNYNSLVQPAQDKVKFLNEWFVLTNKKEAGLSCSFCGTQFVLDASERVFDTFFTLSLSKWLGSTKGFPNLFWDGRPNLPVCKTCRSFFLCFHLIHDKRFFINSNSFLVNWHLNQLIAGTSIGRRTLLNALHYDPQLRRGISSWGLQSMEMVIFEYVRNNENRIEDVLNYYPLSPRLAKIFLIPRLSSLIGKIVHARVWDSILTERFDYLSIIIYKSLRAYITGKQGEKDPDLLNPRGPVNRSQPIIDLIEFYSELINYLEKEKGGRSMDSVNVKELRKIARSSPLNQNGGLVFRLLELTRLNRKSDVYHILLRVYVARGEPFPTLLSNLFTLRNSESFKIGVYAFISGLENRNEFKE